MNLKFLAMIAVSSSLLLVGCGSDSGTESTDTTGTARQMTGTVTGVDTVNRTVTVESVTFKADQAVIDAPAGGTDMGAVENVTPGTSVVVDGTMQGENGIANKIKYKAEVEGAVMSIGTAIDDGSFTMVVMGQNIVTDADTMYYDKMTHESISSDAIAIGNYVEVNGKFTESAILAHRVVVKAAELTPDEDVELKGVVSEYDADAGTFVIGSCQITITAETEFDDIDVLEDGMLVEVESIGEKVSYDPVCIIEAMKIENEGKEHDHDLDEVEGIVTMELMDDMFKVTDEDGVEFTVMITKGSEVPMENTHYIPHDTSSDNIVLDAKVEVKGMFDENDVLMAKLIKFEDMEKPMPVPPMMPDMVKIDAYVDEVDATGGTLTVLGQIVVVNDMTKIVKEDMPMPEPVTGGTMPAMMDQTTPAMGEMTISLADVAAGDYVKVMAVVDDNTDVVAKLIVVKVLEADEVKDNKIKGAITAADADTNTMSVEDASILLTVDTKIEPETYTLMMIAEKIANGDELRAMVKGETYEVGVGLTADKVVVYEKMMMDGTKPMDPTNPMK